MDDVIVICTDSMEPPQAANDLFTNRTAIAQMQPQQVSLVTIIVIGYNRLDKTKRCLSSILDNTKGIDYELILIDNGSSDGTLEYFQSIPHKKRILHITKNLGGIYPCYLLSLSDFGQYISFLPNDLIVTPHWMENLLLCMESDSKIGMVNPVCSNTSNFQCLNFTFSNYTELQRKAAQFNRSNPKKWEDRQRLLTLGTVYRKEALMSIGWPVSDMGFFHDFSDDDITFRMRRMGYRTVLAGDTWVHHDHVLSMSEDKDPAMFQQSLEIGKQNFRDKYYGVDAWDDVNNYYIPFLHSFPKPAVKARASVLGIDVKCGTPILDIKNWLRQFNIFETELSAFTQDAKYWLDLKTICQGTVICDREEFLADGFLAESFDYVLADRPMNRYHEPLKVLHDMFSLCKTGGFIICKLLNTYSFREFLNLLGQRDVYNPSIAYNITPERFLTVLQGKGTVHVNITINANLDDAGKELLMSFLPQELPLAQRQEAAARMQGEEFLFVVEKLNHNP